MLIRIAASLLIIAAGSVRAAELRFTGMLGNSGETNDSLVTFVGAPSAGIGPVIDNAMTIWERD